MPFRKNYFIWLWMLLTMFCIFQPSESVASQEDTWRVGPGVVITSKPYKGVSEKVYPIPFIVYESGPFEFRGISVSYELLEIEQWSFYGLLSWRFDGYDSGDSIALTGMADRDATLDAGFGLTRTFNWGTLTFSGVADTMNKYQGYELSADYSLFFPAGDWLFFPFVGAAYQNSDLVDYYYGVRPNEVRPGRSRYDGNSAINWFSGAGFRYKIDDNWRLIGNAQYEWLSNEISGSPIVDQTYNISAVLGLTYQF